jgi:tyrosyl-tRNA synthetase
LVGLDGKEKMSKSLDNYISIIDTPTDIFGKVMSIPDSIMNQYYILCTFTPLNAIKEIVNNIEKGKLHPKEAKLALAKQITEIYHGSEAATSAQKDFESTFSSGGIPLEIQEVVKIAGVGLGEVLVSENIIPSKAEYRRLILSGSVREGGDNKITDPQYSVNKTTVFKIGKHRFIKIVIE